MKIRGCSVLGALILMGCVVGAYVAVREREVTTRFRVTANYGDGGQQRTASTIWAIALRRPFLPIVDAYSGSFFGKPVSLKLHSGGVVYVTPLHRYSNKDGLGGMLPEILFPKAHVGGGRVKKLKAINKLRGSTRQSPCDYSIPLTNNPTHSDFMEAAQCLSLQYKPAANTKLIYEADPTKIPGFKLKTISITIL